MAMSDAWQADWNREVIEVELRFDDKFSRRWREATAHIDPGMRNLERQMMGLERAYDRVMVSARNYDNASMQLARGMQHSLREMAHVEAAWSRFHGDTQRRLMDIQRLYSNINARNFSPQQMARTIESISGVGMGVSGQFTMNDVRQRASVIQRDITEAGRIIQAMSSNADSLSAAFRNVSRLNIDPAVTRQMHTLVSDAARLKMLTSEAQLFRGQAMPTPMQMDRGAHPMPTHLQYPPALEAQRQQQIGYQQTSLASLPPHIQARYGRPRRAVVLDTETTADAERQLLEVAARLVEFDEAGGVRQVRPGEVGGQRTVINTLIRNLQHRASPNVSARQQARAPRIEDIAPQLQALLSQYPVMGANVGFDMDVLERHGIRAAQPRYDIQDMIRREAARRGTPMASVAMDAIRIMPDMAGIPTPRLPSSLPGREAHRALTDVDDSVAIARALMQHAHPSSLTPFSVPSIAAGENIAPDARQLAQSLGIAPGLIQGSGPGGRVTRDDVERFQLRPTPGETGARESLIRERERLGRLAQQQGSYIEAMHNIPLRQDLLGRRVAGTANQFLAAQDQLDPEWLREWSRPERRETRGFEAYSQAEIDAMNRHNDLVTQYRRARGRFVAAASAERWAVAGQPVISPEQSAAELEAAVRQSEAHIAALGGGSLGEYTSRTRPASELGLQHVTESVYNDFDRDRFTRRSFQRAYDDLIAAGHSPESAADLAAARPGQRSRFAQQFGTQVHADIEGWLRDPAGYTPSTRQGASIINEIRRRGYLPMGTEVPLAHGGMVGTADAIFYDPVAEETVWTDFKTTSRGGTPRLGEIEQVERYQTMGRGLGMQGRMRSEIWQVETGARMGRGGPATPPPPRVFDTQQSLAAAEILSRYGYDVTGHATPLARELGYPEWLTYQTGTRPGGLPQYGSLAAAIHGAPSEEWMQQARMPDGSLGMRPLTEVHLERLQELVAQEALLENPYATDSPVRQRRMMEAAAQLSSPGMMDMVMRQRAFAIRGAGADVAARELSPLQLSQLLYGAATDPTRVIEGMEGEPTVLYRRLMARATSRLMRPSDRGNWSYFDVMDPQVSQGQSPLHDTDAARATFVQGQEDIAYEASRRAMLDEFTREMDAELATPQATQIPGRWAAGQQVGLPLGYVGGEGEIFAGTTADQARATAEWRNFSSRFADMIEARRRVGELSEAHQRDYMRAMVLSESGGIRPEEIEAAPRQLATLQEQRMGILRTTASFMAQRELASQVEGSGVISPSREEMNRILARMADVSVEQGLPGDPSRIGGFYGGAAEELRMGVSGEPLLPMPPAPGQALPEDRETILRRIIQNRQSFFPEGAESLAASYPMSGSQWLAARGLPRFEQRYREAYQGALGWLMGGDASEVTRGMQFVNRGELLSPESQRPISYEDMLQAQANYSRLGRREDMFRGVLESLRTGELTGIGDIYDAEARSRVELERATGRFTELEGRLRAEARIDPAHESAWEYLLQRGGIAHELSAIQGGNLAAGTLQQRDELRELLVPRRWWAENVARIHGRQEALTTQLGGGAETDLEAALERAGARIEESAGLFKVTVGDAATHTANQLGAAVKAIDGAEASGVARGGYTRASMRNYEELAGMLDRRLRSLGQLDEGFTSPENREAMNRFADAAEELRMAEDAGDTTRADAARAQRDAAFAAMGGVPLAAQGAAYAQMGEQWENVLKILRESQGFEVSQYSKQQELEAVRGEIASGPERRAQADKRRARLQAIIDAEKDPLSVLKAQEALDRHDQETLAADRRLAHTLPARERQLEHDLMWGGQDVHMTRGRLGVALESIDQLQEFFAANPQLARAVDLQELDRLKAETIAGGDAYARRAGDVQSLLAKSGAMMPWETGVIGDEFADLMSRGGRGAGYKGGPRTALSLVDAIIKQQSENAEEIARLTGLGDQATAADREDLERRTRHRDKMAEMGYSPEVAEARRRHLQEELEETIEGDRRHRDRQQRLHRLGREDFEIEEARENRARRRAAANRAHHTWRGLVDAGAPDDQIARAAEAREQAFSESREARQAQQAVEQRKRDRIAREEQQREAARQRAEATEQRRQEVEARRQARTQQQQQQYLWNMRKNVQAEGEKAAAAEEQRQQRAREKETQDAIRGMANQRRRWERRQEGELEPERKARIAERDVGEAREQLRMATDYADQLNYANAAQADMAEALEARQAAQQRLTETEQMAHKRATEAATARTRHDADVESRERMRTMRLTWDGRAAQRLTQTFTGLIGLTVTLAGVTMGLQMAFQMVLEKAVKWQEEMDQSNRDVKLLTTSLQLQNRELAIQEGLYGDLQGLSRDDVGLVAGMTHEGRETALSQSPEYIRKVSDLGRILGADASEEEQAMIEEAQRIMLGEHGQPRDLAESEFAKRYGLLGHRADLLGERDQAKAMGIVTDYVNDAMTEYVAGASAAALRELEEAQRKDARPTGIAAPRVGLMPDTLASGILPAGNLSGSTSAWVRSWRKPLEKIGAVDDPGETMLRYAQSQRFALAVREAITGEDLLGEEGTATLAQIRHDMGAKVLNIEGISGLGEETSLSELIARIRRDNLYGRTDLTELRDEQTTRDMEALMGLVTSLSQHDITSYDPSQWRDQIPKLLADDPRALEAFNRLMGLEVTPRAEGGRVGSKETTLVGEEGPEIVSLPTGAFVHPSGSVVDKHENELDDIIRITNRGLEDLERRQGQFAHASMRNWRAMWSQMDRGTADVWSRINSNTGRRANDFNALIAGALTFDTAELEPIQVPTMEIEPPDTSNWLASVKEFFVDDLPGFFTGTLPTTLSGIGAVISGFFAEDFVGFFTDNIPGWVGSIGGPISDFFTGPFVGFFTDRVPGWSQTIGTAFYDFFTGEFVDFFTDRIPGWASTIGGAIGEFFTEDFVGFFTGAIPTMAASVGAEIGKFFTEDIPRFFTESIPGWFASIGEPIAAFFTEDIPRFFVETIPGWFETIAGPIMKFFAEDFVGFFTSTIPGWASAIGDPLREFFTEEFVGFFTSAIPDWFASIGQPVEHFFKYSVPEFFTGTIPGWAESIGEPILSFFTEDFAGFVTSAIPGWFASIGDPIKTFFTTDLPSFVTSAIPGWFASIGDPIKTFFTEDFAGFFTETIPGWFASIGDPIKTFFTESFVAFFTDTIPGWFASIGGPIKAFFVEDFVRFFTEAIPNTFAGVGGAIADFFTDDVPRFFLESVPNAFSGVGGAIAGFFADDIPRFFTESVPNAFDKVSDVIFKFFWLDVPRFFKENIGYGFDSIAETIKTFFLIDVPRFFTQSVPEAFIGVGETIKDFFIDDVPRFFSENISHAWYGTTSVIKTFFADDVPRFFTQSVPEAFIGVGDAIADFFIDDVPRFFTSAVDRAGNALSGMFDYLMTKFQEWFNESLRNLNPFGGGSGGGGGSGQPPPSPPPPPATPVSDDGGGFDPLQRHTHTREDGGSYSHKHGSGQIHTPDGNSHYSKGGEGYRREMERRRRLGIVALAQGGHVKHGGVTLVGEFGPEFVDMPAGARVTPLSRGELAAGMMGGGSGPIEVTIPISIGTREIKKVVVEIIDNQVRVRGPR